MPLPISLTCNFTLKGVNLAPDQDLGVSFQSDNGGNSWGGVITIFTPATSGVVTTGLWDTDGDVFFTIYVVPTQKELLPQSCTLNSGSIAGTWQPRVEVLAENGLMCSVQETGSDVGSNVYNYTLELSTSPVP